MSRLIVSPHPDDAEIGCGALIHKWRKSGHDVVVAMCTGPGNLVMNHSGATVTFDQRVAEQKAALAQIGDPAVLWLGMAPTSKFDTVPLTHFVSTFDTIFRDFTEVYLPLPSYNEDHVKVWRAGLAAFRPGKADKTSIFAYEQPFGAVLPENYSTTGFGKVYHQIGQPDLEAKQRAILAHKTQMNGREKSVYGAEGARQNALMRGLEIGVPLAEMVYLLRMRCD